MKQGDAVLVWGATGGLGGYAVQYVLNGGGTPVGRGLVAREGQAAPRPWAVEHVIDRKAADYRFWSDEHTQDEAEWRRLGKDIRGLIGRDVDIVFEHPGRQTFGASVFVAARGRHDRDLCRHQRLHDRVRQPPPVDEAEAHRQLALRQLRRGVGRQPADLRGQDPADPVGGATRSTRSARPPTRCTTTCTRARSACCASPPQEGLGIDDPELPRAGRRGQDHALPHATAPSRAPGASHEPAHRPRCPDDDES